MLRQVLMVGVYDGNDWCLGLDGFIFCGLVVMCVILRL